MTSSRVVNFGCRLNAAEAATIDALLATSGDGDTLVVNTCAVTQEAERDALSTIRRLKRERPGARIVVTGCAVQIDPKRYEALAEVDAVVGNRDKLDPAVWHARTGSVSDIMVRQDFVAADIGFDEGRTRAFIEVQQGCDHRCTFCIIPFARGPSRSLSAEGVCARITRAVAAGRREVVLTGVDLTAWGTDLPGRPRLGDLCARILESVPELSRLRLSSVDPAEIDDRLFDLLGRERRMAPFLHLSIQAGDDLILKRMKRRHSRARAIEVAMQARAARPDIAITADLIAGFPTESEAAFESTCRLVGEIGLAHAHVFAYSPRPGTPAARMRPLPEALVRDRARRLRETAADARHNYLASRVGGEAEVIVEKSGCDGLDAQGVRVRIAGRFVRGSIMRVRITGHDKAGLDGVPA